MARIVLAMSGGVDSSVAAHLLHDAGHEVIGLFMRHGEPAPVACAAAATAPVRAAAGPASHKQGCCSAADAADARRVADRLDIPFYAIDLQEEFGRIIDYFVREYTSARTPNPCIVCNNWLKFGRLFDFADTAAADAVATGHYGRIVADPAATAPALLRGVDPAKDQSYVLFGVRRDRLARMMLPLGGYRKQDIRQLAARLGLPVAAKRDSQEICFVTAGKYDELVRARAPARDTSGPIVDTGGNVVGRHEGIERFTIGQRKGLGVALGQPRYVVRIEADTRRVVIGTRAELARPELEASGTNWLVVPTRDAFRCAVQIRYNSQATPATVQLLADDRMRVRFDQPCYGVAPGQAAVCYQGDRVLGGGWID